MKKTIILLTMLGLFGMFAAVASHAQMTNKTPRGAKRMDIQKTRIKRGVESGSLTRRETARLKNQRRQIKSSAKNAKSDGIVTTGERRNLRGQLNRSSRSIYRMKHNNRTRRKP